MGSWPPNDDVAIARGSGSSGALALVLDIDGTLIDSDGFGNLSRRPGLDAFLDWCFANCAAVALWTHGSLEWGDFVARLLVDSDGQRRPWAFVWGVERATPHMPTRLEGSCLADAMVDGRQKRLSKVWDASSRRLLGFTRERTLIIEDTPSSECRAPPDGHAGPRAPRVQALQRSRRLTTCTLRCELLYCMHCHAHGHACRLRAQLWQRLVRADIRGARLVRRRWFDRCAILCDGFAGVLPATSQRAGRRVRRQRQRN